MLESLHISNYALIDSIDIEFQPGFNIITGETGAGKSIILGALSLLLGGRADSRTIRKAETKSVIEAVFRMENNQPLKDYCIANDIEWDDRALIMRRELSPSGRSRSFINDSPVNLTTMQDIGRWLIDIHSQHQNQLLANPDFQLKIIDSIASNSERLEKFSTAYHEFRNALRLYKSTKSALARDRDNADFMEFQLGQLEAINLKEGELSQLESDRDKAAEMTELQSNISEALDALSEGQSNALSQLTRCSVACAEIEHLFNADDRLLERLEAINIELTDISDTLSGLRASSSSDSVADLEYIEHRISSIESLMRKHNVGTDAELIDLRDSLRDRLDKLNDSDTILSELELAARKAKRAAMESAREISVARHDAAEKFSALLTEVATPLGMKNLQCNIAVEPADMSITGMDNVEFRFAFNKNQQPIAIAGSASGGEISRLMLSIKSIIAHMFNLPTIIFDEVDTGVSGDVASRMGRLMNEMSDRLQVITITHLPQVAARGDSHFKVYKEDDEHSTHTRIARLSDDNRLDELSLMLSGDPSNRAARQTARALLEEAKKEKNQ